MSQQKSTHSAKMQSMSLQSPSSQANSSTSASSNNQPSNINSTITTQSQQTLSSQSDNASSTSQQNAAQQMSYETGLEYTSDVIRQEKLKSKNQQAANSLVDRMYWQREESLSKSIHVSDKGELEDYDDTPGLGSDKPGL